jgi:hypothetical protein
MKGIKWKDSNEPDLQVEGMVLFKKRLEKSKGMYLLLLSRRQRSAAKTRSGIHLDYPSYIFASMS